MTEVLRRSRSIDRDGLRLHVLTFGDVGPGRRDLLVLPGISSPAAVWDFIAEPLSAGFAVHVVDLRGRGLSHAPADASYGLDDYAHDAAAVIRDLELERPAVLGHSLGARIAAALAVAQPDLVSALVLADPPVSGPGREPYPYPLSFYLDGIRAAKRGALSAERVRLDHPTWTEAQVQARVTWLGTCDERAVGETYRNFHEEDFLALWERLDQPVLIVGATSPVVPAGAVAELLRANASAAAIVVDGAGHMVPWDQPVEFLAAVEAALASTSSTGGAP